MSNKCLWIRNNKGVVLFFVILVIFMEAILAGVILSIIRSNARNAYHRVSRIKAYYAINAAIVYAGAQLYTGSWASGNYAICPSAALCTGIAGANQLIDFDIPYRVDIQVGNVGTGLLGSRNITISTNYTSTM